MATVHQTFDPGAITTLLGDAQLGALGAGNTSAVGTEFDNSAAPGPYVFGLFQLDVTFALAPTAFTDVVLYVVPAPDGATYNDSSGVQNFAQGSFNVRAAAATQQLLSIWPVPLPPTKFKIQVFNNTNRAFPATGTTVKFIPYAYKSA